MLTECCRLLLLLERNLPAHSLISRMGKIQSILCPFIQSYLTIDYVGLLSTTVKHPFVSDELIVISHLIILSRFTIILLGLHLESRNCLVQIFAAENEVNECGLFNSISLWEYFSRTVVHTRIIHSTSTYLSPMT